jgi:hypothetical protein
VLNPKRAEISPHRNCPCSVTGDLAVIRENNGVIKIEAGAVPDAVADGLTLE